MSELVDKVQLSSKSQLPLIEVSDPKESGLACMAMLAAYFNNDMSLAKLRRHYAQSVQDCPVKKLVGAADDMEFASRVIKLNKQMLQQVRTPCIMEREGGDFVVLKKVGNGRIVVNDPSRGEMAYSMDKLRGEFTGRAIEIKPAMAFNKRQETKPQLKLSSFWHNAVGLKKALFKILVLSLLLQAFVLATPFYMQLVMDDVLVSADQPLLQVLSIGFGLLLFMQVMATAVRSLIISLVGNQLSVQMSASLIRHLFRLPINYFEQRHIGDIVSRTTSLEKIRTLLTNTVVESLVDGLMVIGLMAMMFYYNYELAWVVIGFTSVYLIIRLALYPVFKKIQRKIIEVNAEKNTNLMESVRGIQAIKLYNQETDRLNLFNDLNVSACNHSITVDKLKICFNWSKKLLAGLENIIVIYMAANLVMDGDFSVGMIVAFLAYKNQFDTRAIGVIDKFIEFKMISLHLERLSDIALSDQEQHLGKRDESVKVDGNIKLKGVSFRYEGCDEYILKDLDIEIKQGESVAIVGPSGCGKSTLLKIMLGLLQPSKGEVLADDRNIQDLGLQNYRAHVATVMQNECLMSGNLYENISFFETHPDKEHIEYCAKKAGIYDDVMHMSNGFETIIGDMGSTLSSGQIQRVILARALYRKPKVLFLDEATSNLDIALEAYINESIKSLQMTRIFIAHRPQTIASADRILRFDQGKFIFDK